MTQKTYYETLGIPRDADYFEIKKAFRKLAKKLHPDKIPNATKHDHLRFAEISKSYAILTDLDRRKRYDQSLNIVGAPKPDPFWQPHYSGYPYFRYDVFTPLIHGFFMGRKASKKKSPQLLHLSIFFNSRIILISFLGSLVFFKFFTDFEGSVTGKSIGEGLFRKNSHYIEVSSDLVKNKKKRVLPQLYDQIKEGDQIIKHKFSFTYSINGKKWNQVNFGNFLAHTGLIYVFICGGLLFLEISRK